MSRLRLAHSCLAVVAAVALLCGCGCGNGGTSGSGSAEWRMFGGGLRRTSFNSAEQMITPQNAGMLIPRWRFLTGAIVTDALASFSPTACRVGAFSGRCQRGACQLVDRDCDDQNQCTKDALAGSKCIYSSAPQGTPCTAAGVAGQCSAGECVVSAG